MLARYAELNGVEITTEGSLSAYPDADQVSNYAVAYMTWAWRTASSTAPRAC